VQERPGPAFQRCLDYDRVNKRCDRLLDPPLRPVVLDILLGRGRRDGFLCHQGGTQQLAQHADLYPCVRHAFACVVWMLNTPCLSCHGDRPAISELGSDFRRVVGDPPILAHSRSIGATVRCRPVNWRSCPHPRHGPPARPTTGSDELGEKAARWLLTIVLMSLQCDRCGMSWLCASTGRRADRHVYAGSRVTEVGALSQPRVHCGSADWAASAVRSVRCPSAPAVPHRSPPPVDDLATSTILTRPAILPRDRSDLDTPMHQDDQGRF